MYKMLIELEGNKGLTILWVWGWRAPEEQFPEEVLFDRCLKDE